MSYLIRLKENSFIYWAFIYWAFSKKAIEDKKVVDPLFLRIFKLKSTPAKVLFWGSIGAPLLLVLELFLPFISIFSIRASAGNTQKDTLKEPQKTNTSEKDRHESGANPAPAKAEIELAKVTKELEEIRKKLTNYEKAPTNVLPLNQTHNELQKVQQELKNTKLQLETSKKTQEELEKTNQNHIKVQKDNDEATKKKLADAQKDLEEVKKKAQADVEATKQKLTATEEAQKKAQKDVEATKQKLTATEEAQKKAQKDLDDMKTRLEGLQKTVAANPAPEKAQIALEKENEDLKETIKELRIEASIPITNSVNRHSESKVFFLFNNTNRKLIARMPDEQICELLDTPPNKWAQELSKKDKNPINILDAIRLKNAANIFKEIFQKIKTNPSGSLDKKVWGLVEELLSNLDRGELFITYIKNVVKIDMETFTAWRDHKTDNQTMNNTLLQLSEKRHAKRAQTKGTLEKDPAGRPAVRFSETPPGAVQATDSRAKMATTNDKTSLTPTAAPSL